MSLSKLCGECSNCPYVDHCDNKRMEALGELPLPECSLAAAMAGNAVSPIVAPVLRETTTVVMNGVRTTVYKDELEKQIADELSLYPSLLATEPVQKALKSDLHDLIERRIHEIVCAVEHRLNSNTYK